jgi:HPt (histidine-containing phosphotransfer) domain-containing protein
MRELVLLLGDRVAKLAADAEAYPEDAEDFMAALHQSRGSAASLGLVALAAGLGRMEADARRGEDLGEAGRALQQHWREVKEGLLF